MRHTAQMLAGVFIVVAWAGAPARTAAQPTLSEVALWKTTDAANAQHTVFLACQLREAELIELSTNLAASGHPGALLLDSVKHAEAVQGFLHDVRLTAAIPIGKASRTLQRVERELSRIAMPVSEVRAVTAAMFPRASKVILAPTAPRDQLLQAAFLAGTLKAPLWIVAEHVDARKRLLEQLRTWDAKEIYAVGSTADLVRGQGDWKVYRQADAATIAATALKHRLRQGTISALVVANPFDDAAGKGGMAALAPWLALQKHALLLLTNAAGDNVEDVVNKATELPQTRRADTLLLVGNLKAMPTLRRPNPLDGKDEFIEMEPLTPAGREPASFAVGRLFHDDLAVVTLMMARPRLWATNAYQKAKPKALVVSNPGGGLPFLETFSRNTAQELKNGGYEVKSFFNNEANRPAVRAALPDATIFLWEGHHSTLVREYEAQRWTEPMRPSLVFLQSCLALTEEKAHPFLERGAVGVVGSTSRNYSGSGGALSMAYFDAMLYDRQTLGGSLRSAKNFLLAFAQLKEKRMGLDAKMTGASLRTAWSFSLWGDPTLELPRPDLPEDARTAIRHQVKGNTIIVSLPDEAHAKVITAHYQAQLLPNARLAGLISKKDDPDGHPLVPLIYQEVRLPKAPEGKTPHLRTRLPDANWVFSWDARRTTGYLLIRPRSRDTEEIRFHVEWK